jgi:anti-anti-sigma factor
MVLRWPLRIDEERHDGALVLVVAGRLGTASAAQFDAAVAGAVLRGDRRLVIDLKGVDYVSSAGLKALATAAGVCAEARGSLALCGLAEPVRIALDLGGLLADLPVEPSRDDAIARVAKAVQPET